MKLKTILINVVLGILLIAMLYIAALSFAYHQLNKKPIKCVGNQHYVDTLIIIKKDTIFVSPHHTIKHCKPTAHKQNFSVIEMLNDGVITLYDLYKAN
jgi:hypothetical protein